MQQEEKDQVCLVCGDPAYGSSYGAIACISCRTFFKKHCNSKKSMDCLRINDCRLDRGEHRKRRLCQKCRMAKCLAVGMKKDHIDMEKKRKRAEPSGQYHPNFDACAPAKFSAVPSSILMSPPAQSSMSCFGKVCRVCNDTTVCYSYGGIVCPSCSAFFRRAALSEVNLICLGYNNCPIDKGNGRFCHKCRFSKCLAIGMKPEYVRSAKKMKNNANGAGAAKKKSPILEKQGDREHHNAYVSSPAPFHAPVYHDAPIPAVMPPLPSSYFSSAHSPPWNTNHTPAYSTYGIFGLARTPPDQFEPPMFQPTMDMVYGDTTWIPKECHPMLSSPPTLMSPPPPSYFSSIHQHQQGSFQAYLIPSAPHSLYGMPKVEMNYSWPTLDRF